MLRADRVLFEPLRDLEQVFDISQTRDDLSDLREWRTIFLQKAQCPLASGVDACGQEVELGCPLARTRRISLRTQLSGEVSAKGPAMTSRSRLSRPPELV